MWRSHFHCLLMGHFSCIWTSQWLSNFAKGNIQKEFLQCSLCHSKGNERNCEIVFQIDFVRIPILFWWYLKDTARNIIVYAWRAANSPRDRALVQIRDPGKRQPVPVAIVFFSEETTVCKLLIVHVVYTVHLGTSKLTLFLQNALQPSSISLQEGGGHLAQYQ